MAQTGGVELATAYISLVPSMRGTTKAIESELSGANPAAERAGRTMGEKMSGGFRGAVGKLGQIAKTGLLAGGAVVGAAGAIGIKTAAQMETANIAFETMLGSADKAKAFLGDLSKFAAKTPFDLPGLQTSAQSLISIGIDANKVIPIMTTLGNVTSGMGTGAEGVQRATVAIQQMNAAGRITAEDLNQLRDAGVPVFDLLSAATGKTTKQIAEMAQKGKLGQEELTQLMSALESGKGMERFNGMMEKQSQSMSGLWSTLQDTFSVGMADAIQPLVPLIKDGLGGAITLVETIMPKLKFGMTEAVGGIRSFGAAWKANDGDVTSSGFPGFMERAAYALRQLWDAIGPEIVGGIRAFGAAWAANNGDVTSSGFPGFMERVANALRAVQGWFGKLDFSSYSGFMASLGTAGGDAGKAFAGIGDSLKTLMPAFKEFGDQLPNIGAALPELASGGVTLLAGALGFLADNVDTIIQFMPLIVAGFIAFRAAQMAVNIAQAISVPLMTAANISRFMAARAELQLTIATRGRTVATVQANAAEKVGLITRIRSTAATVAQRVATLAAAAGMKAMAIAQRLLNLAMKANPIGIVVTALAALVAGVIWAYNNVSWFKDGVDAAWAGIQHAVGVVVSWLTDTVWPLIKTGLDFTAAAFVWLRDKVIGVFTWIGAKVSSWWTLTQAVWGLAIGFIRGAFSLAFTWVRDKIVGVFTWIYDKISGWWRLTRAVWEIAIGFVKGAFSAAFTWFRDNVIRPVFDGVSRIISNIWERGIKPVFDTIARVITEDVPAAFEKGVGFVKDAWSKVEAAAKAPISFVINTVLNDGLIGAYNTVAEWLKIPTIDPIKIPGFARGGILPGYEARKRDTVLTPMRPGEGVLVPEVVRGIGPNTVNALNAAGNRGGIAAVRALMHPGRALGGMIHPAPGSTVSSGYRTAERPDHDGIDYAGPIGSRILAAAAGNVLAAGWGSGGAGNMVQLAHTRGLQTLYYHMQRVMVRVGQAVTQGQQLGTMGSTGNSTGSHLHFTVRRGGRDVNPGNPEDGGGGFLNPFERLIGWATEKFTDAFPKAGEMVELAAGAGKSLITSGMDWAGKKIAEITEFVSDAADTTATWANWSGVATNALFRTGHNPIEVARLLPSLMRRMQQESGGNKNAVNNWDINAQNGTPSKGLMQVIGPTFSAYRDPNLPNNILDPLANIVASINYTKARYGSLTAGWDRAGGYALGGIVPQLFDGGGWLESRAEPQLIANHTGRPERILTPEEGDQLDALAGNTGGDTFNLYGVPMDKTQEVVSAIMFEKKRRGRGGVHNRTRG